MSENYNLWLSSRENHNVYDTSRGAIKTKAATKWNSESPVLRR